MIGFKAVSLRYGFTQWPRVISVNFDDAFSQHHRIRRERDQVAGQRILNVRHALVGRLTGDDGRTLRLVQRATCSPQSKAGAIVLNRRVIDDCVRRKCVGVRGPSTISVPVRPSICTACPLNSRMTNAPPPVDIAIYRSQHCVPSVCPLSYEISRVRSGVEAARWYTSRGSTPSGSPGNSDRP